MTVEVKALGDANSTMEKVRELRQANLVQGIDFDFAYNRASWTTEDGVTPKHAVFKFYTEKYATFYILKWS